MIDPAAWLSLATASSVPPGENAIARGIDDDEDDDELSLGFLLTTRSVDLNVYTTFRF